MIKSKRKQIMVSVMLIFFLLAGLMAAQLPAEAAGTASVQAKISAAAISPGEEVTIALCLDGYADSTDSIGTIQVTFPTTTDGLTLVEGTKTSLCESGEWSTAAGVNMFVFLPDDFHTLSKDTVDLFSFKMKADENITQTTIANVPFTITIGNQDDQVYGDYSALVKTVAVTINGSEADQTSQSNDEMSDKSEQTSEGLTTDDQGVSTENDGALVASVVSEEEIAANDSVVSSLKESGSSASKIFGIVATAVLFAGIAVWMIVKSRKNKR